MYTHANIYAIYKHDVICAMYMGKQNVADWWKLLKHWITFAFRNESRLSFHLKCTQYMLVSIPHYNDVIMGSITSQITSLTIVYSMVYSDADHRKHQSSASLAFVRGIHRRPVNSPHKWPVTRKMFPFDDVIMHSIKSGSLLGASLTQWVLSDVLII